LAPQLLATPVERGYPRIDVGEHNRRACARQQLLDVPAILDAARVGLRARQSVGADEQIPLTERCGAFSQQGGTQARARIGKPGAYQPS
jgi:hypothetical protein